MGRCVAAMTRCRRSFVCLSFPTSEGETRPLEDGEKEARTIHLICDSWLPIGAISERSGRAARSQADERASKKLSLIDSAAPPGPSLPRSPRNIHRWDKRPVTDGWPKLDSLYGPAVICGSARKERTKEREERDRRILHLIRLAVLLPLVIGVAM